MNEGLRILLVEDDPSFRNSVVQLVGVYNEVSAVGDLAAARASLSSADFDVVLLDLSLPDGNGLSLIREIKSESCNTVVIILTGDGDFNTVKKCIDAGADDYVVKSERIVPDLLVQRSQRSACGKSRSSAKTGLQARARWEISSNDPTPRSRQQLRFD
jgi:DNA-binding NarL/FixJ family response regulator